VLVVHRILWTLADAKQVLLALIVLNFVEIMSNYRNPEGSTTDWPYEEVTA